MKKVYTSEINGFSESGTRIELYAFESEEERNYVADMFDDGVDEDGVSAWEHMRQELDLWEPWDVPAGAYFERYSFNVMGDYFAVEVYCSYNV